MYPKKKKLKFSTIHASYVFNTQHNLTALLFQKVIDYTSYPFNYKKKLVKKTREFFRSSHWGEQF